MNIARSVLGIVVLGGWAIAGAGAADPTRPAAPEFRDAGRVAATNETQFDFTSTISGVTYRVMMATPKEMQPGQTYPVIYVLDGNWYFRAMAETTTWGSGK